MRREEAIMTLVETRNYGRRASDRKSASGETSRVFPLTKDIKRRAQAVATIAAAHAAAVDAEARFPAEAFSSARAQRLLGIMIPVELGGEGASISDVVDVCYVLGRACASTAMIYAMHQIMVACLVRHTRGSVWHADLMLKIADQQLLLASSTTDGQGGQGRVGRSGVGHTSKWFKRTAERPTCRPGQPAPTYLSVPIQGDLIRPSNYDSTSFLTS